MYLLNKCPRDNRSEETVFLRKGQIESHRVIDLGIIGNVIINGVCMSNMQVPSLMVQKLMRRLNLTTDRQAG